MLALVRLRAGDLKGYREVCQTLIGKYEATNSPVWARMATTICLLVPDVVTDSELILRWGALSYLGEPGTTSLSSAYLLGGLLADYRLGKYGDVVERVNRFTKSASSREPAIRAVHAAALAQLGQHAEAAEALRKAREALGHLPRAGGQHDPGYGWWDTVRAEVLIREAEALIKATTPAGVAPSATVPNEEARLDRKERSDRLATELALALIRLDNGRPAEADTLIRKVLAEQVKLVAEEPGNFDYRAQEANARLALGRALIVLGRTEEGLTETHRALAFQAVLAPWDWNTNPERLRVTFGTGLAETGAALIAAGRHAERGADDEGGHRPAARDPQGRTHEHRPRAGVAAAEVELGMLYAQYGLWDEAADYLPAAVRAP